MVKIIGAGFPRTGTSSMKAALERLGYGPCHHMFEVYKHPDQVDRWVQAASAISADGADAPGVDWDGVIDGYHSAVDWPSGAFWREIADAYPDAKIILTLRDPERWYESMHKTIFANFGSTGVKEMPPPLAALMSRLLPVFRAIAGRMLDIDVHDGPPAKADAIRAFEQHNAHVRATVPEHRLLVHEARDGWGPLCSFLGVDEPTEPYPHLNDSATLRDFMSQMSDGTPVDTPFGRVDPTTA